MSNAQEQAEYNLSISTITHLVQMGCDPFQRALQAGYPVAGDLSFGSRLLLRKYRCWGLV